MARYDDDPDSVLRIDCDECALQAHRRLRRLRGHLPVRRRGVHAGGGRPGRGPGHAPARRGRPGPAAAPRPLHRLRPGRRRCATMAGWCTVLLGRSRSRRARPPGSTWWRPPPPSRSPTPAHVLEERRAAGLNGSMQFTYRKPGAVHRRRPTLPGVRTLIAGATSLPPGPAARGPRAPGPSPGWPATCGPTTRSGCSPGCRPSATPLVDAGHRACVVSDQNHLVDRPVAQRAGLGWFGKNANLLLPGRGSWYLLGSVLTDAVRTPTSPALPEPAPVADGCGTCERCLPACPTGAIVAPGHGRRPPLPVVVAPGHRARSRGTSGWRSATGSTAATTARRCARPTASSVRRAAPGGRGGAGAAGRPGAGVGAGARAAGRVRRGAARPPRPLVHPRARPRLPAAQRPGGAGQHRRRPPIRPSAPRCADASHSPERRCCGRTPCGRRGASGATICWWT